MLKKTLIAAVAVAIAVSPLLPRVFADSAQWETVVADAAWDYDYYRVKRLSLDSMSGPYEYNDVVYFTQTAESCEFEESCEFVDITLFKNGESFELTSVSNMLLNDFASVAQEDRFVYLVDSEDESSWGTVYEYDSETGSVSALQELERLENGLVFLSLATDGTRIYFSTLQTDEETGDVESSLSLYDYATEFERDEFTYRLTAPLQEIVDVHEGLALVKFQFEGGFEQLWLVDQTARDMEAIPDTWTEEPGEILGAHFTEDGTVRYFRNYRLFSYTQGDELPVDAGGATLSWFVEPEEAIQVVNNRVAYVDAENGLYVANVDGVSKYGVALNGVFTLETDGIYFQNLEGDYVSYTFSTGVWETRGFHVTDRYDDILVGIDANDNVWYENMTNGHLLNMGYGSEPMLTDREHAYWQGADGNIYEVTFSPLLDLERSDVEAFSAYNESGVYLVRDAQMWLVPDETVYFTWFDSWDDTLQVSSATIDAYLSTNEFMGDLKLAPGTRVKATSDAKVYVIGSDYKLHWITSETVADEIYGSDWNQDIVEVNDTYLWKYATGSDVASGDDVRSI